MDSYQEYRENKLKYLNLKRKMLEFSINNTQNKTQIKTSHNETSDLCSISDPIIRDVSVLNDNEIKLIGSIGIKKILTYKITHSDKSEDIIKSLLECDADIICLQKVTKLIFDLIEENLKDHYLFFEKSDQVEWDQRGKSTTLILSKIVPMEKRSFVYTLIGEQRSSCNIADFGSFVLVNCCLQNGHQKELYAKCRVQMMKYINDILNDEFRDKSIIWLGNFNFDASKKNNIEMKYLTTTFKNILNDEHQKYSLMIIRGDKIKSKDINFIKVSHCQGMLFDIEIMA